MRCNWKIYQLPVDKLLGVDHFLHGSSAYTITSPKDVTSYEPVGPVTKPMHHFNRYHCLTRTILSAVKSRGRHRSNAKRRLHGNV